MALKIVFDYHHIVVNITSFLPQGDFFQKLPLRGIARRALDLSRSRFVLAPHIIEQFREKFFICGLRLYRGMTTIEFENYAYKSKWTLHTFSAWGSLSGDLSETITFLNKFPSLTCISLSGCPSLTGNIQQFFDLKKFKFLKHLALSNCRSLDGDVADFKRFSELQSLHINGCIQLRGDVTALFQLRLRRLNLLNCSQDLFSSNIAHKTTIVEAVERGDEKVVEDMLAIKVDPNTSRHRYSSSLLEIALNDDNFKMAELLLKRGAGGEKRSSFPFSSHLEYASSRGFAGSVELLLSNEPVNRKIKDAAFTSSSSPTIAKLFLASGVSTEAKDSLLKRSCSSRYCNVELVKLMLLYGVTMYAKKESLLTAVKEGNVVVTGMLLSSEVTTEAKDESLLTLCSRYACNIEIIKLLLSGGVTTEAKNEFLLKCFSSGYFLYWWKFDIEVIKLLLLSGVTTEAINASLFAVSTTEFRNIDDIVELLLSNGADVRATDTKQRTPLIHLLCHFDNNYATKASVERILDAGADLEAVDEDGNTVLLIASKSHRAKKVGLLETLILRGANAEARDNFGRNSLMAVVKFKPFCSKNFRCLLSKVGSIEAVDNENRTALLSACRGDNIQGVTALLESGANIEARGYDGLTALTIAVSMCFSDIAELLVAWKANIEVTSEDGRTPLIFAAQRGNRRIVSLLLDKGANQRTEDTKMMTAWHYAKSNGHKEVMAVLNSGSNRIRT